MTNIPFLDLKAEYEPIAGDIQTAIRRVFERGQFILGPEVHTFEKEFAEYVGVPHGIGVGSGTDALNVALRACGIGPGDEVITVAHTAVATVAAIELAGARPVLVDIGPGRYTMDPQAMQKAITPRTRAVLPVHLYGAPSDLAPILAIAREQGLRVIEDACQAHGARYGARAVGAWGDLGCFSFYPSKNLGAYGDGGMVVTGDAELAERTKLIRTYGWAERDKSVLRGLNSRLDELHAAMLRVRLTQLEKGNERRRALAALYEGELAGIPDLELPVEPPDTRHVYHLYVVRTPRRDELRRFLAGRGIGTLVHYPIPVHLQPGYQDMGYPPGSLPESEKAAAEILSLPLSPGLSDELATVVARAVREFFRS